MIRPLLIENTWLAENWEILFFEPDAGKPSGKKEVFVMTTMLNHYMANMSNMMAEDVNAPELRNPLHSGMRKEGWLRRLMRKVSR